MARSVKRHANILKSQCIRLAAITAVVLANLSTSVGLDWVLDKNGQMKWASKCDFDGVHLIKNFKVLSEEECGSRCIAFERCTHVNMIGKTCFLKEINTNEQFKERSDDFMPRCGFAVNRVTLENRLNKLSSQKIADAATSSSTPSTTISSTTLSSTSTSTTSKISTNSVNTATPGTIATLNAFQNLKGEIKWAENRALCTVADNPIYSTPIITRTPKECAENCLAHISCNYFQSQELIRLFLEMAEDGATYNCYLYNSSPNITGELKRKSKSVNCGFITNRLLTTKLENGLTSPSSMPSTSSTGSTITTTIPSTSTSTTKPSTTSTTTERSTITTKPSTTSTTTERSTITTKHSTTSITNERSTSRPSTSIPPRIYSKKEFSGKLIWQEEFNSWDQQRWTRTVSATNLDNSFQYFSSHKENSFVRDGILFIKPTLTIDRYGSDSFLRNGKLNLFNEGCYWQKNNPCTVQGNEQSIINPVASAQITSEKSFNFTAGTIEIRAKMPKGDWITAGIYLKPSNSRVGIKPGSGVIKIASVRGNERFNCNGVPYGRQMVTSGLSFEAPLDDKLSPSLTLFEFNEQVDYSSDFHLYRLHATSDGVKFFIDDQLTGEVEAQSDGDPFHFAMNVKVGGKDFPADCDNGPAMKTPLSGGNPHSMKRFWEMQDKWLPTWDMAEDDSALQIDYIRVYPSK